MVARWGFEGLCIAQDKHNSYHSKKDELQGIMDEFIENKKVHRKEIGKKAYKEKKTEILNKLDILRKEFKKPYGNRELHTAVNEAMEDFDISLGKKFNGKIPPPENLNIAYPMFVNEKKLPFINKVMSTEIYNSMILAGFSLLLAMLSIILLAYREKITKLQQKIIMIFKK